MRSPFLLLLLAIVPISSSLASATFCFPRSSHYAVPISTLEAGYEFFPSLPKPVSPPVQKPAIPTPKPETPPPVAKPETLPVTKPATPSVAKPEAPPSDQPKKTPTPAPAPQAGGSNGATVGSALDGAFAAVIKSLCAQSSEPDLCFNSIKPLVGTIKVSHDGTGVLKLAIEALKEQTDASVKIVQKFVADPKTDKKTLAALNDCLHLFDDAKYNLGQIDGALKINDKATVNTLLSTIGTEYDTCDNGFTDLGSLPLMADIDAKLMKMNSICLAIALAANLMT